MATNAAAIYNQILAGLKKQGLGPGSMLFDEFANAASNPGAVNPTALQYDLVSGASYGAGGAPGSLAPLSDQLVSQLTPLTGQTPANAGTPPTGAPAAAYQPFIPPGQTSPAAAMAPDQPSAPAPTPGVNAATGSPGALRSGTHLLDTVRGTDTGVTQPGDPGTIGGGAPGDPTGATGAGTGTSSLPLGLGGLNLGSLNMGAMLPALFSSGLGLWSLLGSNAAFDKAGNLINNAEVGAGNEVQGAAQGAQQGVTGAAGTAASGVAGATGNANDILSQLLGGVQGQNAPYQGAGTDAVSQIVNGLNPGGSLNSNLTADQVLQNDPGYQFRLGQGEGDLQARLASEGLSNSGEAAKQLSQFQQDYASNEFNNAWQRNQTQQQNLFSRLAGTAGIGQNANANELTAAETLGAPQASNLISSSQYGGNAAQTAAENAGLFGLQGSQYQGNANVTGAGAQAGAVIDANQQKQAFIQQLMTSILSLFGNNQNNGSGSGLNLGSLLSRFQPA